MNRLVAPARGRQNAPGSTASSTWARERWLDVIDSQLDVSVRTRGVDRRARAQGREQTRAPDEHAGLTASSTWRASAEAWTGSRLPLEADEHAGLDGQLDVRARAQGSTWRASAGV
ncbi:MAG: hypothetical protein H6713_12105 [Myxococcales bacterium]|nr:hypothetical protein [Myxococcales bacterium]